MNYCSCPKPDLETRKQEKQLNSKVQWWMRKGAQKKTVQVFYCRICGLKYDDPDLPVTLAMNFYAPPKENQDDENEEAKDS